ncbi:UEV-domain-containing protein [Calocera cornea HHB12733]|uniref:UEV-domain-containing protein n=1 Tax=Calocera cornea HHB12733 TaxID=1353952 RepID=A0A165ED35_9BASI|nr:UEV-domain-containing protein [Calocera cornea HHB12733]
MNGRASGSSSSLQNWLRTELVDYASRDIAFIHIEAALLAYHLLKPKRESFIYDDGRSHHLLSLAGLLPISYRGASYNIPIALWIPFDYPNEPPMVYVVPTKDMVVKAGKELDPSGKWMGEYLKNWGRKGETCNIRTLLETLTESFSREPPLYRKAKEERGPQAPTPPVPSPAPGRPMSGASYDGGLDRPPMPPPRPPPPGVADGRSGSPGWASPVPQDLRARPPPPLPLPNGTSPHPIQHMHPTPGRPLSTGSPPVPPHPPYQPYQPLARSSLPPQGTPPIPYSSRPTSEQYGQPHPPPPLPGQPAPLQKQPTGPAPPFSPMHPQPQSHQPAYPSFPQPQPTPAAHPGQPPPPGPYPPQHTQQTPVPYPVQPTPYPPGQPPPLPPQPAHARTASWTPSGAPAPGYSASPGIPGPSRQPSVYPSLPGRSTPVQQPQPRPRIPQPDFLSSDPDPSPRSTSPPPPLPPNPHTLQLHTTLLGFVQQRLQQHLTAAAAEVDRLQKLRGELEQGPARIQDEMARLAAVRDVCLGVVARLEGVVGEAEGRLADVKARGEPTVDEIVCADTIVGNQLIDLVADDNAIEDTMYHLHRALNSGRIDLDRFIKVTRALAEEQFMKRALVEKILNGLPMGMWSA